MVIASLPWNPHSWARILSAMKALLHRSRIAVENRSHSGEPEHEKQSASLPEALARRYPGAVEERGRQHVLFSGGFTSDPLSGR